MLLGPSAAATRNAHVFARLHGFLDTRELKPDTRSSTPAMVHDGTQLMELAHSTLGERGK